MSPTTDTHPGAATQSLDEDSSIVTCRIARSAMRIPRSMLITFSVAWIILFTLPLWPGVSMETGIFAFVLAAIFTVGLAMSYYANFENRLSAFQDVASFELTPLEFVLKEQDESFGLFGGRWSDLWSFESIMRRLADRGIKRPRTIVDLDLAERMRAIERPAALIEPEPIMSSSRMGYGWAVTIIVFYVGNALLQFLVGNYLIMGLWIAGGVFFAAAIPAVRDQLRLLWDFSGKVVAGQGWARDHRNRVWTTADAIMVVRKITGSSSLELVITGPAGATTLSFINEKDPDFIKLWQRWNHPDPRPELAGEG